MTTIVPAGVTPTGERVERVIDGIGTVTFENYGPGEWMTKKGDPAKIAKRRYLLDGEEIDSVSSIVGTLDKPALLYWYEDQTARGAVQAERMGELVDVPEEDYAKRIKALGLGASAKRDEGADRGNAIHAAFHKLATEGKAPNPAEFPALARPWVQGALCAWLAMDPELIASEEIVCNPVYLYGGRPDLVAMVDGKRTLIDYKTGKGRVYDQAHYQTRLYEMALRHCGVEIERIVIVGINDSGGFELIDCEITEAEAEALIVVYRSRRRANCNMAVQRNVAKAAVK